MTFNAKTDYANDVVSMRPHSVDLSTTTETRVLSAAVIFCVFINIYIMFHRDERLSIGQDSFCGVISGVLARTVTAPLDFTKILYQVGLPCAQKRQYLFGGLFNLTKHVVKQQGPLALFRGNGISCMKMFPATTIQFGTYYGLRSLLANDKGYVTTGRTALAAAGAGYAATVLTYPMNVVKTRMIVKGSRYTGPWDCLQTLMRTEGNMRVWSGLSAALLSTIPSTVSLFVTYELIERSMGRRIPDVLNESLMEGKQLSHGIFAAIISLVLTHPLDTCKKKMQAYNSKVPDRGGVDFRVRSLRQCWHRIYSRQWIFGLYSGFAPAFIRLVPFHTFMLWSYNYCRKLCIKANGLSPGDQARQEAIHEQDLHDLEYMLKEDLLENEPPSVRDAELYHLEQISIKKIRKKKYLEDLVEKMFIYKNGRAG